MSISAILPAAPGQAAHPWPQIAVTVDACADQGQAGVAGVEFVVALLEDQSLHVFTCQGSFRDRCILQNFYRNFSILNAYLTNFY